MPKRKRSADENGPGNSLQAVLEEHQHQVFRALKIVKGFERQRLSKRLRERGLQADKQQRLEREVAMLKSLDLRQTARAHLAASLLRIQPIASSSDLPDEFRAGVSKPHIPEDVRVALHNVTSGLYNKDLVKQAMDRAVAAVCSALDLSVPDKPQRHRKDRRIEKGEQPADGLSSWSTAKPAAEADEEGPMEDKSEFEGFDTGVDESPMSTGQLHCDAEAAHEAEFSKYNHLLGDSSDEADDLDESRLEESKGREKVNLDDISLSGSASDTESELESKSSPRYSSPPPAKHKKHAEKMSAAAKAGPARASTFLPSLMGGYISGSESASDIEEAKPKKRRGQRARQAIWEKKYGANARHLQEQDQKGGRDAGWDMKRGAVDGDGQGHKKPLKRGVNPLLARNRSRGGSTGRNEVAMKPEPKPTKRRDEGPLHPSWAAKKKASEAQKGTAFSGQKIVFD